MGHNVCFQDTVDLSKIIKNCLFILSDIDDWIKDSNLSSSLLIQSLSGDSENCHDEYANLLISG